MNTSFRIRSLSLFDMACTCRRTAKDYERKDTEIKRVKYGM